MLIQICICYAIVVANLQYGISEAKWPSKTSKRAIQVAWPWDVKTVTRINISSLSKYHKPVSSERAFQILATSSHPQNLKTRSRPASLKSNVSLAKLSDTIKASKFHSIFPKIGNLRSFKRRSKGADQLDQLKLIDPLYEEEEFSPLEIQYDTDDESDYDSSSKQRPPLSERDWIQSPFPSDCDKNSTNVGCAGVCPETCEYRSTYCIPLCGPPCKCNSKYVYNIAAKACTLRSDCPAGVEQSYGGVYRVFE